MSKLVMCDVLHPEAAARCALKAHHLGDHESNGLTWKNECYPDCPGCISDDPINPKHYTSSPSGIECIQVVEHLPYNRGAAIKYLWRCGEKGPPVEDLKKARWHIDREIKRLAASED